MVKLNLPEFQYSLKEAQGKIWIFDIIRKRFVILTPEEWVRQHFVNYIINNSGYPRSLIKIEGGLVYNRLNKRSDIVVYNRQGAPWMIIECKAPDQKLTQQTLQQVTMYNVTLKAKYFAITNGLEHYCSEVNWGERQTILLSSFPDYD
jgi:hypothetical protein